MSTFSKNQINFYTVTEKDDNQRLDNLLTKILKNVPKNYIFKIIRSGEVRINKKRAEFNTKVCLNDLLRIPPIEILASTSNQQTKYIPQANFNILFEDEYYLIIDKPSGIACHGGSGVSFGVIEQLRSTYPDAKFLELAHRIDRDTSGILVLAKKRQALVKFQDIIRNSQLRKIYLALVVGELKDQLRNVKAPLHKYVSNDGQRRVRVDNQLGQYSHSIFSVISKFKDYTLVQANIKTGRTHQIRVHLQHIGFPIAMDDKYGNFDINKQLAKLGLKRMFLHAHEIDFIHPITIKPLKILSPIPKELQIFIDICVKMP
ncbi:MAG: RluA family pseudouridine synthase [Burkholderiales bacterium]|nr:RluA family pseudouridine synthase [Burkholderiales bacterium]